MKTPFLVLTTAAALAVGALAFAGTESENNSSKTDTDRLQKKITVLESRIKSLERRWETQAPPIYVPQVQPRTQTPTPGGSLGLSPQEIFHPINPPAEKGMQGPKIWGEGEINGWKYYIIPCAAGSGASPEANPLKVIPPK